MPQTSFPMSSIDLTANLYVDIVFVLDAESAPTFEQLRRGMCVAAQVYPQLGGVLSDEKGTVAYDDSPPSPFPALADGDDEALRNVKCPIPLIDGGSVPYSIEDFECGALSAVAFAPPRTQQTNPPPLGMMKRAFIPLLPTYIQGLFRNHSYNATYTEAAKAAVIIKYTRLCGKGGVPFLGGSEQRGAVIGLSVEHRYGDAHATALIGQFIARCTRWVIGCEAKAVAEKEKHLREGEGEAATEASAHAEADEDEKGEEKRHEANDIPRSLLAYLEGTDEDGAACLLAPIALLFDREEYTSKALVNTDRSTHPELVNVPPTPHPTKRRAFVARLDKKKKDEWYPLRGVSLNNPRIMTFRFSPKDQSTIKAAAQARALRHGHPMADRLSTRDAVTGYLFSLVLAASHASNIKRKVNEDPKRAVACTVALNVRSSVGMRDEYAGNAAIMMMAEGRVFEDWLGGAGAATRIREVITECKEPPTLRAMLQHFHDIVAEDGKTSAKVAKEQIQPMWCHGDVGGFADGMTSDWSKMGWDKCHFTPAAAKKYAQKMLDLKKGEADDEPTSATSSTAPSMIATPIHIPLPGHIKLIDDVTAGENGALLCHVFLSAHQYEELAEPDGALYEAAKDLEWIGKDWGYSPNIVEDTRRRTRIRSKINQLFFGSSSSQAKSGEEESGTGTTK